MKKNHLKLIAAALFIGTTFTIYSCSKDDDSTPTITPVGIAVDPTNFKGDITNGQIVTLDPTKVYKLTGAVNIKNGGKLVIPAGTRIIATLTTSFIIVEQGGQIYANGTSGSPVLLSASSTTSGSWGGLVICGKAPINTGSSGTSELGNATYGGTVSADNSGSLSFVRIENTGAVYTGTTKFNGLSLFGVGSGTTIGNVSLVNSANDGIHLYGGTVNLSNIVSINNLDDAFEWTDGWNGTATGIYTKRKADGIGNTGIKGTNNTSNPDASPRSNPIIKNVTFLGATTGESNAIKLKSGTYATIDNAVTSNWTTGVNIESDSTVAKFNGHKKITNVLFNTTATKVSLKSTAGANVPIVDTTYTEKADAVGAGNGILVPTWATGWSGL